MSPNAEIETTLQHLTELCCDAIKNGGEFNHERAEQLTANLSTNGWSRHSEGQPPLSNILKDRIRTECPEPAIHRGAAIDGVVGEVQSLYERASRYEDKAPGDTDQAMSPRTMT
ncbi:undecaprenyl pyrophosphate synthase [Rhodopirellula rubra]|uniref:Undecaprenyl pyrophosphate synthase n=1 Tax=Aporhodopirellula rubra TaxID=980271 RepID=A0A7W5H486_9BACT|nr:hypothetical protein [Aporhodopirellula rubra]MBB3204700.1 undecaprenyl pyrophosphate synthase [Aporhodopirellula rubra]